MFEISKLSLKFKVNKSNQKIARQEILCRRIDRKFQVQENKFQKQKKNQIKRFQEQK